MTKIMRSTAVFGKLHPTQCTLYRTFCTNPTQSVDDMHASARQYFYFIDKDGRLYLEETTPKTFVTAFKSVKFLDFFWRHIKNNPSNVHAEYPWISYCGKELNFIKCEACSPIIFFDLLRKLQPDSYRTYEASLDHEEHNASDYYLQFGGSLKIALDATAFKCDVDSGRLYHRIPDENNTVKCSNTAENGKCDLQGKRYGVVGSHLLLRMSNLQLLQESMHEDRLYDFVWNGLKYEIPVF